jgi:activating signal cointegrator complex subunit 3
MRPGQSPLRQFQELPFDVIKRLEMHGSGSDSNSGFAERDMLLQMSPREVGELVHNQKLGSTVLNLVKKLPHLEMTYVVQPITRGILRLALTISADFEWADRHHGIAQSFWIFVEDGENEYIYHSEMFLLQKKTKDESKTLEFTIPIREPMPPQYYVRAVSDSWVGCESTITVSFKSLLLPTMTKTHTDLLDMHPIPKEALGEASFHPLFSFSHFNPVQTQCFHVMYHTDMNALVAAPTGSGKTVTAELALLRLQRLQSGAKTVYIAPMKALARERLSDWQRKFSGANGGLKLTVLELTGDVTPDMIALKKADVLVVTPEKWDSISRGWQRRDYVKAVQLIIIDEIHLLGVDRGPVLVSFP